MYRESIHKYRERERSARSAACEARGARAHLDLFIYRSIYQYIYLHLYLNLLIHLYLEVYMHIPMHICTVYIQK